MKFYLFSLQTFQPTSSFTYTENIVLGITSRILAASRDEIPCSIVTGVGSDVWIIPFIWEDLTSLFYIS